MTILKKRVLHSYSNNSIHFHPNPEPVENSLTGAEANGNDLVFDFESGRPVTVTTISPSSSEDTGIERITPVPPSIREGSPLENGQYANGVSSGSRKYCRNFRKCTKILRNSTWDRKDLVKTFPVIGWLPEYTVHKMVSDIIAGLTVGLTILPQGLAYATVAGLPPIVN